MDERPPQHSKDVKALEAAIEEARLILARHDGMHLLHSDYQALLFIKGAMFHGSKVDPDAVDRILHRMRQADHTGVYPTHFG